ncbi:MAG: TolC family protein [Phycisphaerae bacterium]|nr:TolC family protein [Phycisphaerae bacterium]
MTSLPSRLRLLPAMILALGILLWTGCALNHEARVTVDDVLQRYGDQISEDADKYGQADWVTTTAAPSTQPTPGRTTAESHSPVSLRDYIVVALRENPDIKAAEEMARSSAARVPQSTALPDPVLAMKVLPEPIRTAEGDNPFVLGIRQKLIVPGKLEHAGRVALQEARMALEVLQATRLRVIGDVKRTYYRIYIIDQTIEVDRTNQDLLRGLIDVARSQSEVGKRGQEDVLRAQVELSNLEGKIIELQQERETAVARMNRLLNRRPQTSIPPVGLFELRSIEPTVDHLLVLAGNANPDLDRLRQQIERDREATKLAKLQWWPDFTVGLEWIYMEGRTAFRPPPNPMTGVPAPVNRMSESGSDNWAITFGFNIPIWAERIRGGIEEARRRMLASQHQYASERNSVFYNIEDALARIRAQRELALLFRDTIIPQAQQAYEVSRASYTAGTTSFLFVIDNWQKWLTFTIQYHRALGQLEQGVADLEQAVGLSLGEVGPER